MIAPCFSYVIQPLSSHHNRIDFHCGIEPIDRYLQERAGQDQRRFLAAVFVLQDLEQDCLAGCYTLAATAIQLSESPLELTRKLPKYPQQPQRLYLLTKTIAKMLNT